ncbi:TetR/AcrR family transcriptional regulator [Nocardia sp. NPDC059239]|uniref:TetR/AcrR family transcriptional regulator n=1 Tax=unclassified Nocardia TaxID=2637762 RepID=UPI0036AF17B9
MVSVRIYDRTMRAVQRQQARQHTLAAATKVFVTRGYHASTMDEIAQNAGYSKPALYSQFSSKLELYLAVLQDNADTLTKSVQRALHASAVNQCRLRGVVQAFFDFVDNETQGFRLVFNSDLVSEPSVQWHVGRAHDACVSAVCEIVTHNSELNAHQARILAVGMVGASQFAARYWLETGRAVPKTEAVAAVIALCWGGLSQVPLHPRD